MCYSFDFKCLVFHFDNHFKFYINFLIKIHENFHVKDIFHHDKSNRMKVYTRIYLVSIFLAFYNFVLLKTNAFYLLHIYPSLDFLSKYLTARPEEIFLMYIEKPFIFFKVKKDIKSNHNNLLSFNYWPLVPVNSTYYKENICYRQSMC